MDQSVMEQEHTNIERRRFLKTTSGLTLAGVGALAFPQAALASDNERQPTSFHGQQANEKFWKKVRKEFVLNKRTTYMNVGTSGSMPEQVLENFEDYNEAISENPWQSNIPTIDLAKQVAHSFGADQHELVLSRNTTDGMCSILNGLQFEAGDIILTTHHEHGGALSPLRQVRERYDVEVIELSIPVHTRDHEISADDFVNIFADAVALYGSRVRLITFSHVTYTTGTRLPAKRICQEVAIPNRIPTLIDGAHTPGMLNLDFHDIDCDFYSGAGHKWQCGPGATGILYIRDNAERLKEFWNDRATPLWCINSSSSSSVLQARFQSVGQDNYPAKRALVDACHMWDDIGRDKIEKRVLDLSELCKDELLRHFPHAHYFAPNERELASGLSTFNPFDDQFDGDLVLQFRDRLHKEYGYIVRTISFLLHADDTHKTHAIRVSTHLFHNPDDVTGLAKAMQRLYRTMA
ncbi:MAG: aminotransferase class V-fold PLP-dependent enzyme [Shewanella sp.]